MMSKTNSSVVHPIHDADYPKIGAGDTETDEKMSKTKSSVVYPTHHAGYPELNSR